MESIQKFKATHPIIAAVLTGFVLQFIIAISANLVSSAVGQVLRPARVYEEPTSSSQVVYNLDQDQIVAIVGEEPYYFEVQISDDKSQKIVSGYVSKRSLELCKENGKDAPNIGEPK